MNVRIRLTLGKFGIIQAEITKTRKRGCIDKKYVPEAKLKELRENGFAYINQPAERVV